MREIETRTSTMTDEREDTTPEQWVDILGEECPRVLREPASNADQ